MPEDQIVTPPAAELVPPVVIPPSPEAAPLEVAPVVQPTEQQIIDADNKAIGDNVAKAKAAIRSKTKPPEAQTIPSPLPNETVLPPTAPADPLPQPEVPTPIPGTEEDELSKYLAELKFEDEPTPQAPAPADKPVETPAVKDAYTIKELAERFGVQAESMEDFEKGLSSKMQKGYQSELELNQPLREIDDALTLDDKTLVAAVKKYEGYTDQEITEYLDSLEESQGKGGLKREALGYRAGLRQQRAQVEASITEQRTKIDQAKAGYETDIRNRVLSMEKISGVPVNKAANETFADRILKGEIDKKFSDINTWLEATRLYEERDEIFKSLLEKGARSGFNKAKAIYDQKVFNKDIRANDRPTFIPPLEQKGDSSSEIDKARKYIKQKTGRG